MSSSIRDCLNNSDIHGVRFWLNNNLSRFRRTLWFLVTLAAFIGFSTVTYTNVQYYYSYPTSLDIITYHNEVPLPGIAICPHLPNSIYYPLIEQLNNLTDEDFLYILYHLGVDITVNNTKQTNIRSIAADLFNFNTNLDATSHKLMKMRYPILQKLAISGNDTKLENQYLDATIDRLKTVNVNALLDFGSQYPDFMSRFGVTDDNIESCMITIDDRSTSCKESFHSLLTSSGGCMVLDNINGSAIYLRGHAHLQKPYVEISIRKTSARILVQKKELAIFLYDRNELPDRNYDTLQEKANVLDVYSIIKSMTKVTSYNTLALPYNSDKPCGTTKRSFCIKQCVSMESACVLYFLSDISGEDGKPWCKPKESDTHLVTDSILAKCSRQCNPSCQRTEFKMEEKIQTTEYGTFQLRADKDTKYTVSKQVALYNTLALLGDLGGMIGLFLGASLLTLYHCMEYTCVRLINICCPKASSKVHNKYRGRII